MRSCWSSFSFGEQVKEFLFGVATFVSVDVFLVLIVRYVGYISDGVDVYG